MTKERAGGGGVPHRQKQFTITAAPTTRPVAYRERQRQERRDMIGGPQLQSQS
jgi:hypothetical protein